MERIIKPKSTQVGLAADIKPRLLSQINQICLLLKRGTLANQYAGHRPNKLKNTLQETI
jgi:hypothetical protein